MGAAKLRLAKSWCPQKLDTVWVLKQEGSYFLMSYLQTAMRDELSFANLENP